MADSKLRSLPSVTVVMDRPALVLEVARHGRRIVLNQVRETLDAARRTIQSGAPIDIALEALERDVLAGLARAGSSLRPVINATGILLHTGLGRAPLAEEAIAAVRSVAAGYCNLEFDLETGERGQRITCIRDLIRLLSGAEDAIVVNNNAAATILALRAVAAGREVVVSRGELVEIGGSFRLPEIFEVSGARLREVGTTNKTRIDDFSRAIGPETAALMRVHASNFRIVGFTESVSITDLAALGRACGLVTIDDIGSGAIDATRPPGVFGEPTVRGSIAAGADLVLFSGDKLLGGPQCGIVAGRGEVVAKLAADPLMRAVRVDKMTLAALEATLRIALEDPSKHGRIPLWRFLTTPAAELEERAARLAERLGRDSGLRAEAAPCRAYLGGGSLPDQSVASFAVRLAPPWPAGVASESGLARSLRLGDPAVVARLHAGNVWIDLRAVDPTDDDNLAEAVARAIG
jgi:L-seryl-tRNA(Ser) seleniumtransferase